MKFGVFANMINQTPSLASWWWFYTKDKENNLISLDESIKVGNFHPQIKHFSKLKTKILRKIRTLHRHEASKTSRKFHLKFQVENTSQSSRKFALLELEHEFLFLGNLSPSPIYRVWSWFELHFWSIWLTFLTLFMYKLSSISRWYDF